MSTSRSTARVTGLAVLAAAGILLTGCVPGDDGEIAGSATYAGSDTVGSDSATGVAPGPGGSAGVHGLTGSRAPAEQLTMDEFLTFVLEDVDRFWSPQFVAAGLPEPVVTYEWPEPGVSTPTSCDPAGSNDQSAFYCPADDTIVVSQQFAIDLWNGAVANGDGTYTQHQGLGDFSVAYVIAHEYAHSLQQELGILDLGLPTVYTELHADCAAGVWANSADVGGLVEDGDVEEVIASADLLGDYAFDDPEHHGTPEQRTGAWLSGYNTGDLAACQVYLPA